MLSVHGGPLGAQAPGTSRENQHAAHGAAALTHCPWALQQPVRGLAEGHPVVARHTAAPSTGPSADTSD